VKKRKAEPEKLRELRKKAEALMKVRGEETPSDLSAEEVREVIHDLRTHQIELEMQNEELLSAQAELLESRNRYSDLYDFAPAGYLTIDAKGLILEANLTLAEMLGVKRRSLINTPFSAFVANQDQDAYYRHCRRLKETTERKRSELRIRTREGACFWALLDSVKISGSQGVAPHFRMAVIDITERKEAEEKVHRLQELVNQANEAIFLIDPETSRFLHVNQRAGESLGYTTDELLALGVLDIDAALPSLSAWSSHVKEVAEKGAVLFEGNHKRKDGSTFPVEASVKYIAGMESNHMIAVVRDISERRREQAEKKQLETQLRQAQKMEAIGTLAGGIAHDFNNVLGIILGNVELAANVLTKWNPVYSNLEKVRTACFRARDMILQILSFSRQTDRVMKPVHIGFIVRESLRMLRATIPTTVEIREDLSADEDLVLADPAQINQIMMNLCTNAAHAMRDKGGGLSVGLHKRELPTETGKLPPGLTPGTYLVLTVGDTGHGMRPEIRERIFDPYFTTKPTGEGTGMGLSVLDGIVRNHDGAVLVQSEPGKGAVFEVFLPLFDGEAEPEKDETLPLPTGSERILLVDDEEDLAELGKLMLEQLGYKVTTSTEGIAALGLFREAPEQFDLVVTDMTMPHLSGADLAVETLRIRPDIPVILCTGFSEIISAEKAKKMGIRAFVTKPLSLRMFAETVRQVLDQAKE